jgi:CRP-like cAMP-binding protein
MSAALSRSLIQNSLLAALPPRTLGKLLPHLEEVQLTLKDVLEQPGDALEHVYFPQAGMISITVPLEGGQPVEVGTIGKEGMLGSSLLLGGETAVNIAMVQIEGSALRIPVQALRQQLDDDIRLRAQLGRYAQSFYFQVAQTAACNGTHSLNQRCARWLLLARHRVGSDNFPLTHEFLAMMLAVERPGVTLAARALQRVGAIRYTRGNVTILDTTRLETLACECSRVIQAQEARLLN